jgi:pyruvate,water dikinase
VQFKDISHNPPLLRLFYQRSRQFFEYREKFSLLYSYSWMLFRPYYLAIGARWVTRGWLSQAEDIFYLYDDEVRAHLDQSVAETDFRQLVVQRRLEMEQCREAILPEVILGDELPLSLTFPNDKLAGTPTSKGYYTGPIRVIRGIDDFPKLQSGEVLVIPFSEVSWSPLFALAGAVVAESGGILSHCSIIAREYNIPAVVSVAGALQLADGLQVTVDGFKGEIHLHEVQS